MLTWTQIESAAVAAGWKRAGVEWRGPCPFCGGRDRAHVRPGSSADFIGSCRRCGADGIALARALVGDVGEAWPASNGPGRPALLRHSGLGGPGAPSLARATMRTGDGDMSDTRPARLWAATEALTGTAGAAYLESRGLSAPWPAAVRWLPAAAARLGRLRPTLPADASGAVCYRFAAADEDDTHAVQVEAVRDDGARVLFATQGKRPSVKGSRFESGARVFVARAGGPDVHVCESVVDSLSVATAAWGAPVGAAVIAAAGTSGLSAAAVSRWPGTVTVWAQGDGPGLSGALRLCLALEGDGRTVRSDVAPAGMDWGEVAAQEADKRNALRKDAS